MDTTTVDSKKDSVSGEREVNRNSIHPVNTNSSKAAEASARQSNQRGMATIEDDDDRLLVRIGYTPVSEWLLRHLDMTL
jgi:hypothetical protein